MINLPRFDMQRWLFILLVCCVSGCKVDLYTGLSEEQANDMLAILLRHGIDAGKSIGDDDFLAISVEESRFADAVEILKSRGYPRASYDNIGEIFEKEGLVSSPMEERFRFVYALSQELADTISRIEGVLDARVHVVLPNAGDGSAMPSSAAIFVKHTEGAQIDKSVPDIKNLITNSIEGLSYDRVSVTLFPSEQASPSIIDDSMAEIAGIFVSRSSIDRLRSIIMIYSSAIALIFFLVGFCTFYFFGTNIKNVNQRAN
ncbi:MAG: type III secretion system inner membrane ring lipoprotein SctJ [Geminicoccaceae bacterium]